MGDWVVQCGVVFVDQIGSVVDGWDEVVQQQCWDLGEDFFQEWGWVVGSLENKGQGGGNQVEVDDVVGDQGSIGFGWYDVIFC